MPKEKTGVRKIALELRLPEDRYATDGVSLTIRRKASARTLPDAICEAVRAAFDDPAMERKVAHYPPAVGENRRETTNQNYSIQSVRRRRWQAIERLSV